MRMQTLGNSAKKTLAREGGIIIRHLTRLMRSEGKDNSCASRATETLPTPDQLREINPQTYLAEKARRNEVETEKAMIIIATRHERWQVGGPN